MNFVILSEEEVYNGSKRWLINNGYAIIAGQPARGVDHLPVIEIKMPSGDKGSRDAYKPDLVAFKDDLFFIIECKPEYNDSDRIKILNILNSEERLYNFYVELKQYQLLRRVGYGKAVREFYNDIRGILAFSGMPGPACELKKLIVEDWKGKGILL